jgi:hypothetical protein
MIQTQANKRRISINMLQVEFLCGYPTISKIILVRTTPPWARIDQLERASQVAEKIYASLLS